MHEREQRMRRRIAELEDYAQKRACPIYGISGNKGQLIGSGFLLKVNEKTLLISAAHVLDAKTELAWHGPGIGMVVPIEGQLFTTCEYDQNGQPDYKLDIAFVVLRPGSVAAIACEVLTPADLDVNDLPAQRTLYGFTGFPASRNRPGPGRKFRRSSLIYTAVPAPDDVYRQLRYHRGSHLAVNFDQELMVTRDLQVTTAPDPHGISGGPVWRLGAFSDIEAGMAKPMVVAVAIVWSPNIKTLVGVRISLAVEGIRKVVPEAANLFPPTAHVNAKVRINPS